MVSENRIRNRVNKAFESVFDHTLNGDAVKDKNYIEKYGVTLKHCYVELEQYRKLYKSIKQTNQETHEQECNGSPKGTFGR